MAVKSKIIAFRCTPEELKTVSDCANIVGLPVAEYVRRCAVVPVDLNRKELFNELNTEAMAIYDRWGIVLDKLTELVKEDKKTITPNKIRTA